MPERNLLKKKKNCSLTASGYYEPTPATLCGRSISQFIAWNTKAECALLEKLK